MQLRRVLLLGDKMVPLVLAGYFAAIAVSVAGQWRDGDSPAFYPPLWPFVFGVTALLLFVYAWKPNHKLGAVSGAAMVACILSRAVGLGFSWANGNLSPWRTLIGALTWGVLAWAISYIWLRLLEIRG